MGLQARMMSQGLRKITGILAKTGTSLIFINQIRMKIGVMFGNPETTTGGNALKFYASQRLDIRRIAALKNGEDVIGNRTRVKVVKNKVAPPFKEVEFDILYGEGISREGDLLDLASEENIIEKSGTWYTYQAERMGQGRENARTWLKERPEFYDKIKAQVLAKHKAAKAGAAAPAADVAGTTAASTPSTGKAPTAPTAAPAAVSSAKTAPTSSTKPNGSTSSGSSKTK